MRAWGRGIGSLALGVAIMAAGGCKRAETPATGGSAESAAEGSAAAPAKRYYVVFSQCNNAEPYRAAQNKLLRKLFAAKGDVDLDILDAQQDNKRQIDQIRDVILKRPDLLIVAPNEREPLTRIMGEAMNAKIPVICLERDIVKPNYTTWIRCDNYKIGKLAGEFIVAHLKEKNGEVKGTIVELCGLKGVEGEENRWKGAHDVFDKYGLAVAREEVADWMKDKARKRMTDILTALPEIDVVYGHNDPMAAGAYLAAQQAGREDEMIFVGVDGLGGEAGGIKQVIDGVLASTFVYPLCVDKAVEIGYRLMTDKSFKPEKSYLMESMAITKDNAAEIYAKTSGD